MYQAHTKIHSPDPKRIMTRLSKHWAHKFEVQLEDSRSLIPLPVGQCLLSCDAQTLQIDLTAETSEDLAKMQQIVADHLVRMAAPEVLEIVW